MATPDNVQANAQTIPNGPIFRSLSDGAEQWPASVPAYVEGGSPGAWQLVPVGPGTPLPTADAQVTPAAATASEITTGGTAVTLVTGPIRGGYVTNPPNSAAQGIAAAENAYLSLVGTPSSTDAEGNGTTTILAPGQSFELPPLAAGVAVKANAASSGHKLTVVVW